MELIFYENNLQLSYQSLFSNKKYTVSIQPCTKQIDNKVFLIENPVLIGSLPISFGT